MLANIDKKELEQVLEKIIEQLIEAGFIPAELTVGKKKDMVSEISNGLANDDSIRLSKDKLNEPETLKLLGAACLIQCKPQGKMNFLELFKKDLKLTLEDKNDFQELYRLLLNIKSENDPKKREELVKRLDELLETLAKRLRLENKDTLIKDLHIQKLLADQRWADYGVDTQNPGGLLKSFQGVCMGNLSGRINLAMPGSDNAAGQAKDDNIGKDDPIGTKAANAVKNLLDGSINTPSELAVATAIKEAIPSTDLQPESPKPSPFH